MTTPRPSMAGWATYMVAFFLRHLQTDLRMAKKQPACSIVYIDGFNFYYGSIKGGPHKWLDLELYFRRLRPDDDLRRIYYFTTRMIGPKLIHQATYLRALETLPLVEVRLGRFKRKTVACEVSSCVHSGPRLFDVNEEKQTDVAIGIQMVCDAYENNCDRFIIVSGDSDLLPALSTVRRIAPKKEIIVYIPAQDRHRGAAVEMRNMAHKDKTLPIGLLRHCHFSDRVPDGAGGFVDRPAHW